AALGEMQAGAGDEIGDETRHQDLAALSARGNPLGHMQREAADGAAADLDFADMDAGSEIELERGSGLAQRRGAAHRSRRPIEICRDLFDAGAEAVTALAVDRFGRSVA